MSRKQLPNRRTRRAKTRWFARHKHLLRNGVLGLVNQSQVKPPYHGSFGVTLTGDAKRVYRGVLEY